MFVLFIRYTLKAKIKIPLSHNIMYCDLLINNLKFIQILMLDLQVYLKSTKKYHQLGI